MIVVEALVFCTLVCYVMKEILIDKMMNTCHFGFIQAMLLALFIKNIIHFAYLLRILKA